MQAVSENNYLSSSQSSQRARAGMDEEEKEMPLPDHYQHQQAFDGAAVDQNLADPRMQPEVFEQQD